jgi:hypothetical protein
VLRGMDEPAVQYVYSIYRGKYNGR